MRKNLTLALVGLVAATGMSTAVTATPASAATTPASQCHVVTTRPVLQYGMVRVEVKQLQCELNAARVIRPALASAYPQLAVDGSFGDGTLAAVRAYQSRMGLAVDGSVGPATWGSLDNLTSGTTPAPSTTEAQVRQRIVNYANSMNGKSRQQFCSIAGGDGVPCYSGGWCQDFVWWAWIKAGVPGANGAKNHSVDSFGNWAKAGGNAQIFTDPTQVKPGDAVVWLAGGRHVAVVTSVNSAGKSYVVMNGNYQDRTVGSKVAPSTEPFYNNGVAYFVRPVIR